MAAAGHGGTLPVSPRLLGAGGFTVRVSVGDEARPW